MAKKWFKNAYLKKWLITLIRQSYLFLFRPKLHIRPNMEFFCWFQQFWKIDEFSNKIITEINGFFSQKVLKNQKFVQNFNLEKQLLYKWTKNI